MQNKQAVQQSTHSAPSSWCLHACQCQARSRPVLQLEWVPTQQQPSTNCVLSTHAWRSSGSRIAPAGRTGPLHPDTDPDAASGSALLLMSSQAGTTRLSFHEHLSLPSTQPPISPHSPHHTLAAVLQSSFVNMGCICLPHDHAATGAQQPTALCSVQQQRTWQGCQAG